jgi:alpha-glucosidase
MNSWNNDGVVNLPWMYPEVLPQVRAAMALRYRLMPYLYTLLWRAAEADEPMVRPSFYAFPDDARCIGQDDVFMLGADILVAPVLDAGATTRRAYLPATPGGWHEFTHGTHHAGGEVAEIAAPLGRLPVFVRSGAMIPVTAQLDTVDPATDKARTLLVFGEEARAATLYEDDGDTAHWREHGLRLRFTRRVESGRTMISLAAEGRHVPAFRDITLVRVGPGSPVSAATGGETLRLP